MESDLGDLSGLNRGKSIWRGRVSRRTYSKKVNSFN